MIINIGRKIKKYLLSVKKRVKKSDAVKKKGAVIKSNLYSFLWIIFQIPIISSSIGRSIITKNKGFLYKNESGEFHTL